MDVGEIDDEVWEDDVAYYIEPGDMVINLGEDGGTPADEGKPPQVTAAELASLDEAEAAGYDEITRLFEMNVLQEPTAEDLEEGAVLSARSVMDWRFREQRWRRRCRFVAREFNGSDKGSASTFALVFGIGARLVLLMRCCFRRCLSFIDIKDAFLLVPQRERILVEKPSWWSDDGHSKYWSWNRCLPGQRNAAARFFDFHCDHLQEFDFENSPCCRSGALWRIRGELMWLIEELRKVVMFYPLQITMSKSPFASSRRDISSPRRGL